MSPQGSQIFPSQRADGRRLAEARQVRVCPRLALDLPKPFELTATVQLTATYSYFLARSPATNLRPGFGSPKPVEGHLNSELWFTVTFTPELAPSRAVARGTAAKRPSGVTMEWYTTSSKRWQASPRRAKPVA